MVPAVAAHVAVHGKQESWQGEARGRGESQHQASVFWPLQSTGYRSLIVRGNFAGRSELAAAPALCPHPRPRPSLPPY